MNAADGVRLPCSSTAGVMLHPPDGRAAAHRLIGCHSSCCQKARNIMAPVQATCAQNYLTPSQLSGPHRGYAFVTHLPCCTQRGRDHPRIGDLKRAPGRTDRSVAPPSCGRRRPPSVRQHCQYLAAPSWHQGSSAQAPWLPQQLLPKGAKYRGALSGNLRAKLPNTFSAV